MMTSTDGSFSERVMDAFHSGQANIVGLERRVAELEGQLAETDQLLAMVEGQPEGGLPGWVFEAGRPRWENMWKHLSGAKVFRVRARGVWQWEAAGSLGESPTVREAIAAAEVAYQEVSNGQF